MESEGAKVRDSRSEHRIVGYWPRLENLLMTFLKLLAAIFGRSIWVSQRATTSRVTIWVGWVRKIGARGDIPFTLIASKRLLFTFSFPRTKSNGLLDYGIARKFSSYLSSYLDADNVGRQCFQQHYGFSSYCFRPVEQTAIFVTRSFWDSLKKKRFEETRYFVDRQAGKEK